MNGGFSFRRSLAVALSFLLVLVPSAWADRTQLKPGMNKYTPQQDIALGKQFASQVEKDSPLCNNPKIDAYLTKLGTRLVTHLNTFGVTYPWEFHCVNDKAINAFALPGGYVFINRGAIEAADYEAELAAVMAHELSHVALRHGTNQATKAQYGQIGAGLAGIAGAIFGGAAGSAIGGAGQFAAGSVLLKYSRGAETQADVMGTQVLYDANYDPRAMAAFFEKIGSEKAPPEFFSDHPSPDHRVERVEEEIQKLGGVPANAQRDSADFQAIKKEAAALPVVAKPRPGAAAAAAKFPKPGAVKVGQPSQTYTNADVGVATLKYPDNWKQYGGGDSVTLAPDGGIVDTGNGQPSVAYGFIASLAKFSGQPPADQDALRAATDKLIQSLQQENPNMRVTRDPKPVTLNGQHGLSTYLSNDSPNGGQETDWLVTVMRPDGLAYFICAAPQREYNNFSPAFGAILDSVRFKN